MSIFATIDRFESDLAILHLDDGQEFTVSKKELPGGLGEGARLVLQLNYEAEDEAHRTERARQLLSDLLQRKQ